MVRSLSRHVSAIFLQCGSSLSDITYKRLESAQSSTLVCYYKRQIVIMHMQTIRLTSVALCVPVYVVCTFVLPGYDSVVAG